MPFNNLWKINGNDQKWPNQCHNSFNSTRTRESWVYFDFRFVESIAQQFYAKAINCNFSNTFLSFLFFRLTHDFSKFWEKLLMIYYSYFILGICSVLLLIEIKVVYLDSISKLNAIEINFKYCLSNSIRKQVLMQLRWLIFLFNCSMDLYMYLVCVNLVNEFLWHSTKWTLKLISSNGICCQVKYRKCYRANKNIWLFIMI